MATLDKIVQSNFSVLGGDIYPVYSKHFNTAVDQINTNTTTLAAEIAANGALNSTTTVTNIYTKEVTLTASTIVGSTAGTIGHTDGAILVSAPSSSYALEFVSAVLIYDYDTAAYTGGNDDMTIRVGSVSQTSAITDTNCIKGTGDKVYRLGCTSTQLSLGVGSTINLKGTAFTQPGTAAGVLRVQINYRIHTTGL